MLFSNLNNKNRKGILKMKKTVEKILKMVNEKRQVCISALLILIITIVIAIICFVCKNKNSQIETDTTNNESIEQEIITEETSTEDVIETEEEPTEENIVSEEVVAEFFEKEISTENREALELPSRKLTSELIPYDGLKRNISYYGDSMVAGAGCTTEGYVNGKSIFGWNSPLTIQNFTGIRTYNMGVGGESSYTITLRAGGIRMYLDRDISISEDDSAQAMLIDEYGDVVDMEDYSGFGYDYNSTPGDMYVDGYLCDVSAVGGGIVNIKLTKGYAAYSMNSNVQVVSIEGSKELQKENLSVLSDEKTEDDEKDAKDNIVKETNISSEQDTQKETESSTEQPAQNETESSPEQTTQKETENSTVTKKIIDLSEGTEASTKATIEHSNKDILVLEMGSNGGWSNDYQELILQYDNIILNSGCKYYIIVGDTDDPAKSADANQDEYDESGDYVGIGDTSWEAALREAYGDHFFNARTYLIQYGLSVCGLSVLEDDLDNYRKGNISEQLRYDWTHFNCYGYYAKGVGIYKKGIELGYWN